MQLERPPSGMVLELTPGMVLKSVSLKVVSFHLVAILCAPVPVFATTSWSSFYETCAKHLGLNNKLKAEWRVGLDRVQYRLPSDARTEHAFAYSKNPAPTAVDRFVFEVDIPGRSERWIIPVLIPPRSDNKPNLKKAESVRKFLASLPLSQIDALDAVAFSPFPAAKQEYYGRAGQVGGHAYEQYLYVEGRIKHSRMIIVYPPQWRILGGIFDVGIMRHEFGHFVIKKIFGTFDPPEEYLYAMQADGNQVSSHGSLTPVEDVAEAIELYIDSLDGPIEAATRKKYSHRFRFIDGLFVRARFY